MGFNKYVIKCDLFCELLKVIFFFIIWFCFWLDDFIECIIIDWGREKVYVYMLSILMLWIVWDLIILCVFICLWFVLVFIFDDKI